MKQTLILFFTLVVTTISYDVDNYIDQLANFLSMQRENVQTCMNKANVTVEDIRHFNQIAKDDLTTGFDDTPLKVGCLFACLGQNKDMMTGAHLKMDKIKEIVRSKNPYLTPDELAQRFQVFDTCSDQVKDNTNECEVGLKFTVCAGFIAPRHNKEHDDDA